MRKLFDEEITSGKKNSCKDIVEIGQLSLVVSFEGAEPPSDSCCAI